MKISAYKTNLGLFIKQTDYPRNSSFKLNGQLMNHDLVNWLFLKGVHELTSYEYLKKGTPKFVGYTLKIASVACDEIPLNLTPEDVEAYNDEDGDTVWKHFSEYLALYKPVHEPTPDVWESIPIELTILREYHIEN